MSFIWFILGMTIGRDIERRKHHNSHDVTRKKKELHELYNAYSTHVFKKIKEEKCKECLRDLKEEDREAICENITDEEYNKLYDRVLMEKQKQRF